MKIDTNLEADIAAAKHTTLEGLSVGFEIYDVLTLANCDKFYLSLLYAIGVMHGKRAERARRKRRTMV